MFRDEQLEFAAEGSGAEERMEPALTRMDVQSHPLLHNDDILQLVFRQMFDGRDIIGWTSTLASSARVSTAFCSPALDVLWYDVTILPLLKTLGLFLSQTQNDGRVRRVYYCCFPQVLEGFVAESRWARFQSYAGRVRRLTLTADEAIQVHPSVFRAIGVFHAHYRALFPVLRHLDCSTTPSLYELQLFPFITGSLREVTIGKQWSFHTGTNEDQIFGRLLSVLSSEASEMNYLYLGCDIRPSLLIQHIVHFTRLKHLFLEGPISSSQLLSCCGGLVDLAFLSVSGLREPSQDDVSSIGFPSLRELKMTSDPSIPGVIHLLASVSSPHLQEVALLGLSWDDLDEWRSCFCVLCSKFSSSLRKIDVTSFAPVNASSVSFMHIVQPLLGISGIQSFTIWCDGSPFMLTDYDIHDIASSWQNLEDLYLRVGEGSPRERPSVYAIDAFAQFCPRLRQLTISCLDIFLPPPWPLSLTMFPRLTELNCGKGDRGLRETTDAAMRLAHFLHDRCPCLDLHTLARNSPDLFLALRDLRSREGNQSDDDSVEAL